MKLSDLQIISQKALELCEQCKNYVNEIEHLNGVSELAIYHAVERNERSGELDGWVVLSAMMVGPVGSLDHD